MIDYEERKCFTCRYIKVDQDEDPCRDCFAFDAWEEMKPKTAAEVIYDWERRTFNGNSTKC